MESDVREPLNIGSDEMISINGLAKIIEEIAGIKLNPDYDLSAPKGVRGRNSDNTKILELLNWEPKISLKEGLTETYQWIEQEVSKRLTLKN
jgi:nucleoside-diphosphate-sugar epimerase